MPAKRTKEEQAAYMRAYRARKAGPPDLSVLESEVVTPAKTRVSALEARILELEDEVRRLKRELADRPQYRPDVASRLVDAVSRPKAKPYFGSFGEPRPAPKPGK
jgi:hypothetical protein